MKNYIITPYVGVGELKFGMVRSDIYRILGLPIRSKKSRFSNEVTDFWNDNGLQLIFGGEAEQLLEISLYPNLQEVEVNNIKVFSEPGRQVYNDLCRGDGEPMETVGVVILFSYGVAITGFLNADDDQKSITAFSAGRWNKDDKSLKKLKY